MPGPGVAGSWFTVITIVFVQPAPNEYTTVAVPLPTPYTTPELLPIVATDVGVQVHVPPPTGSPRVSVAPTHRWLLPVMLPGAVFTVTTTEAEQPGPVV